MEWSLVHMQRSSTLSLKRLATWRLESASFNKFELKDSPSQRMITQNKWDLLPGSVFNQFGLKDLPWQHISFDRALSTVSQPQYFLAQVHCSTKSFTFYHAYISFSSSAIYLPCMICIYSIVLILNHRMWKPSQISAEITIPCTSTLSSPLKACSVARLCTVRQIE